MIDLLETKDLELTLDSSGKIIDIQSQPLTFDMSTNGSFIRYLHPENHGYFLSSIHECKKLGVVFGDKVQIIINDQSVFIYFVLIHMNNKIRLINFNESKKIMETLEDIIRINNQLVNEIRRKYENHQSNGNLQDYLEEISKLNSELVNSQRMLIQKNEEISSMNRILERLTYTDDLTKINNRRKFFVDIHRLQDEALLVMMDFNHFKVVNDTKGHEYGDYVLMTFAKEIKEMLIPFGGEVYRIGGDEFAAIIKNFKDWDMQHQIKLINQVLNHLHPAISMAYGEEVISKQLLQEKSVASVLSLIDHQMYAHKNAYKKSMD